MSTGMNLRPDRVGAKMKLGGGTGTIASAGVAVKLVNTSSQSDDASGFTVGTDGVITATFPGTRLIKIEAVVFMNVASGTDACTIHVFKNGVSIYETGSHLIASATLEMFRLKSQFNVANGDTLEIYVENEDDTADLSTVAWAEFDVSIAQRIEHGYVIVSD